MKRSLRDTVMKRILCYGDSNTWGQLPYEWSRLPESQAWTTQLGQLLGADYQVLQQGLSARVAGDYEAAQYLNGRSHYAPILLSARPVAAVVIALGSNDLKAAYGRSADDICHDLLWYVDATARLLVDTGDATPPVLLVLPANLGDDEMFAEPSALRAKVIAQMTDRYDRCIVLDGLPMSADGMHYSPEAHTLVAQKIHYALKEVL